MKNSMHDMKDNKRDIPMKIWKISIAVLLVICFWTPNSSADIYSWKDENGIMHFTNYSAPPGARMVVKDVEIPRNTDTEEHIAERTDLLEEQAEQLDKGLKEVKDLVEDLANRLTEANRMAEEVMENAEALEDEPYYSESYYSGGSHRYLYLCGVKWRYRPGFYDKRHYSKPTISDTGHLHQKRHTGKSHLKGQPTGLHHKRLYSKPTIWESRFHQKRHYGKSHVTRPRSGFHVKTHIGRSHSVFSAKDRVSGRAFAFGAKARSGGGHGRR